MRKILSFLILGVLISTVVFPAYGMGTAPKKEEYKLEILKMEIISSPEVGTPATPEAAPPIADPRNQSRR